MIHFSMFIPINSENKKNKKVKESETGFENSTKKNWSLKRK